MMFSLFLLVFIVLTPFSHKLLFGLVQIRVQSIKKGGG